VSPTPSAAPPASRRGTSALIEQGRILHAIMIRDLMARFGREGIGFGWAVLEPMILTAAVLFLWSTIKGEYEEGVLVIGMVLTGYAPLTLWRHMTRTVALFRNNKALLFHRKVTLLDIFMSQQITELAWSTLAPVLIFGFLLATGYLTWPHDTGLIVAGWLLLAALASGVGLVLATVTEYGPSVEFFVQPIQYLLVPLSGIFFIVEWLPVSYREIILYNPIVHPIEMIRSGLFGPEFTPYYNPYYPAVWALALWTLGGLLLLRVREKLA